MKLSTDEETWKLGITSSVQDKPPNFLLTRSFRLRRGEAHRREQRNEIHPSQGSRRKANYFDYYTPVFTIRQVVRAECSYFFFMAFSAALVTLPDTSLKFTALMTPTATV